MAHVSVLDASRRVSVSATSPAKFHIIFSIREKARKREREKKFGQFFSVSLHTLQFYFNIPGFKSKQKLD
ncbi:hypothetical protein Q3G72_029830 [Acer saccharum]|nr:hypothetical protein Q3G72_029830 [Acer saccharum]